MPSDADFLKKVTLSQGLLPPKSLIYEGFGPYCNEVFQKDLKITIRLNVKTKVF